MFCIYVCACVRLASCVSVRASFAWELTEVSALGAGHKVAKVPLLEGLNLGTKRWFHKGVKHYLTEHLNMKSAPTEGVGAW